MRNLLLSGGPGHDFDAISEKISAVLGELAIETTTVTDPAMAIDLLANEAADADRSFDLFTVHALHWRMVERPDAQARTAQPFSLTAAQAHTIDSFVRAGGGLLALHAAVICFDAEPTWRALCGAAWAWNRSSHPPQGSALVEIAEAGRTHPLTVGLEPFTIEDEVYGFLDQGEDLDPLLTSRHGGRAHPVCWARQVGAGRVVTDVLGHDAASYEHPAHRQLLHRAATWSCGLPAEGSRR